MKSFYFGILAILMIGCQPKFLNEANLTSYVNDESNGLIVKKNNKKIDLSVNFHPTDLLVAQELRYNKHISESNKELLKNKYKDYAYFVLNISTDNQEVQNQFSDFSSFSNTLQTLSFDMHQKVNLTTSESDTILVADFTYPRLYGASNSTTLLFVFNNEKFKESDWIEFHLKEIGLGIGSTKFRFETDKIKNIPQLEI